ncbi:MAG: SH3 domain-containing protein [Balneola sp.]|nr:MAG: SH3 domain-containing protein [Balneola sp.]
MKKLSILLLSLMITVLGKAQESAQLLFDQANTLLEESEYYDALNQYRNIESMNMVSGALFLNMGIAATQIDSIGLAKYYFLKASSFPTTKSSALEALQYVESQFSRQSAMLPKLPWDRAVDWLKEEPTSTGVFLIGFILLFCTLILILLRWFTTLNPKRYRAILLSMLIPGVLLVLLAFYVDYVDYRYSQAVIIENEIQVRQRPDDASELVSLAYEGYEITVDESLSSEHDNWLYIRLGNGQFGWIHTQGVKIL